MGAPEEDMLHAVLPLLFPYISQILFYLLHLLVAPLEGAPLKYLQLFFFSLDFLVDFFFEKALIKQLTKGHEVDRAVAGADDLLAEDFVYILLRQRNLKIFCELDEVSRRHHFILVADLVEG